MSTKSQGSTPNAQRLPSVVFGPIYSRRFGKSLGIDLSPAKKQCNFDCLYCELTPAQTVDTYDEVVAVEEVIAQVKKAVAAHPDLDVLTVTANGEPTLYPYLDELIDTLNTIKGDAQTLILSNASTIDRTDVQKALMKFDEVKLSLDCATPRCLKRLDRAHKGIDVETIKRGMSAFASRYKGRLVIEILLVAGINDTPKELDALNRFLLTLKPDRIDIGTVDRPPAYDVAPLKADALYAAAARFDATLPVCVVTRKGDRPTPSSYDEAAILRTLSKRPLTREDVEALMDKASITRFEALCKEGKIVPVQSGGILFYKKA